MDPMFPVDWRPIKTAADFIRRWCSIQRIHKEHRNKVIKPDYSHYFELLDNAIKKGIFETIIEEKKVIDKGCCKKMKIVEDNTYRVCVSCGRNCLNNTDYVQSIFHLKTKYKLSTYMLNDFISKYKSLKRLHKWSNYDYRENAANVCYDEITTIGKSINLSHKVISMARFLYKVIYIDNKISSRSKIKRSIYCYCLYRSACHNKIDINIIELLHNVLQNEEPYRDNKDISNYNKALSKIKDKEKLYLNNNIKKYYELLMEHYKVNISINDFIKEYNRIVRISKRKRFKLNFNSLLLTTIYHLINNTDEDYRFYEIFNTTYITLSKFKKLLNLL